MKKTVKRLLATIMTAVMILTAIPFAGIDFGAIFAPKASAKDISSYSVGDIITYGSYPQSKVTDSSLISAIETAGNKYMWVSYNYYSGTGDWRDGEMQPDEDMMWYKDIPYNGNVYRAVWIKKYRPYCTGYTSSSNEQQSNGYYTGNVYYFKYEPLKWRVLDPAEGFVMCTTAIDAQAYNNYIIYNSSNGEYYGNSAKTYYASDWANSSIRYWLNNDFYSTAFSSTEKSQIGTTYNENKSTWDSKYDSANTSDKIFLLSYNEVLNSKYGFSSSYSTYDPARQIKSTDYAKCQGCWQSTSTSYYGNSWWRLRSPDDSSNAAYVYNDGYANYSYLVNYTYYGIVPAFKFNPKSTIPESVYKETFYVNKTDENFYKSFDIEYGESLKIPETPSRDGYTFTGWYDINTDKLVDLSKETMDSKEGRSFYAGWQANKYTATLKVDGNVYQEISYIYGQKSISLPAVPEKAGYTGEWESYSLGVGGVIINAVYTANKYVATLKVDGKVYKEITYTYGQKSISLPAVPEKAGYTGEWESYSLGVGGVIINAVYTKIPADVKSVSITGTDINYKEKAKLLTEINATGKYTKTFTSSNSSIVMVDNEGNIYGAKRGSAKITCTLTDSRGNTVSDTCTVNVKYAWWQWVIEIVLFSWIGIKNILIKIYLAL